MPLVTPYIEPSYTDPVTHDYQPTLFANNNPFINGPYLAGGNLYTVLASHDPTNPLIDVFKSTDMGVTWATVDHAGAPSCGGVGLYFQSAYDGLNTIWVVMLDSQSVVASMQMVAFDLLTQTWGSPSVALPLVGGTHLASNSALCVRANGNPVVMIGVQTTTNNGYEAFVEYSGGGWQTPVEVDTNAIATIAQPFFPFAGPFPGMMVGDSTGALHFFFGWLDTAQTPQIRCFYQRVDAANSLSTFVEWTTLATVDGTLFQSGLPRPSIIGNTVVLPIMEDTGSNVQVSLLVGTGLANPSFAVFHGLDAVQSPYQGNGDTAQGNYDGTTFTITWTADFLSIRKLQTTDFLTWVFTAILAFDLSISPTPPGFNFSGQQTYFTVNCPLGIEFACTATDQSTITRGFQPYILASPPIPTTPIVLPAQNLPSMPLPNPASKGCL